MDKYAGTSERSPFDMLIGDWIGVGILFLPNGAYYSHVSSRVTVHEVENPGGPRLIKYYNNSSKATKVPTAGEILPNPADSDHHQRHGFHSLFSGVVASICDCEYTIIFEAHGKVVHAIEKSPSIISATGHMSTNDNYAFVVRDTFTSSNGDTTVLTLHNNHYWSASNTRHVIGTISDADGDLILTSSFTYTSYTPPDLPDLPTPPAP